ncbi:MAG: hypothetical protein ACI9XJ_000932 [Marivirga sp.]|jgi:hypothetical protein
MKINKIPLYTALLLSISICKSQAQSINSAGKSSTNSTVRMLWSIGGLSIVGGNNISPGVISKIILDREIITSVKQEFDFDITTYPNPTSNFLYVEKMENNSSILYSLLDPSRQEYFSTETKGNAVNLDLSALPNGLYILKIKDRSKTKLYKIIKK